MYMADIRYGNKVMVFDHSLGLITGAVSQRLAGMFGHILHYISVLEARPNVHGPLLIFLLCIINSYGLLFIFNRSLEV